MVSTFNHDVHIQEVPEAQIRLYSRIRFSRHRHGAVKTPHIDRGEGATLVLKLYDSPPQSSDWEEHGRQRKKKKKKNYAGNENTSHINE
eukprot:1139523-Pelagomonas_calceolata.AAC.2